VGFAVGYFVGAQQGREGLSKLISSWQEIQNSEEFAAIVESGREMITGLVKQVLEQGTGALAGEVKDVVNRRLRVA